MIATSFSAGWKAWTIGAPFVAASLGYLASSMIGRQQRRIDRSERIAIAFRQYALGMSRATSRRDRSAFDKLNDLRLELLDSIEHWTVPYTYARSFLGEVEQVVQRAWSPYHELCKAGERPSAEELKNPHSVWAQARAAADSLPDLENGIDRFVQRNHRIIRGPWTSPS